MTITYTGDFAVPLFDMNERFGALQTDIYQAIYSDYPFALNAADISTAWGGSIRERFLRFSLFGGNATIELTPVQLVLDFQNLGGSDVDVAKRCIEKTLEAVRETYADANMLHEALSTSCTLDVPDGNVREHLSFLSDANVGISPAEVGATELFPVFAVELANEHESWHSTATVKIAHDRQALFVFSRTEYAQDGAGGSIGHRIDQQYLLINALLMRIQVQVNPA